MDVKVKRVDWSVLASKEVQVRFNPFILEWPKNFGSIQYTPHELLSPGWKYIVLQLWMIRSYIDAGEKVNFPEYDTCVETIAKWGQESMWTLPTLVRNVLGSLLDEPYPYLADWRPHGSATNMVLHNEIPTDPTGRMDFTRAKKNIVALNDNEQGFHLLRLYRDRNARPVFEQTMVSEPMVMLSCRKLAFKNEIDAILQQQLVTLEEQETAT